MKQLSVAAAVLLTLPAGLNAQSVVYHVSFPNAVHHEAEITMRLAGLSAGKPVELRMSRSSPGRYALHEFAKNVYSVSATDGKGHPLSLSRADPYGWTVRGQHGTVEVHYTLYGDHADGTYAGIDSTHAHLNIPATFMWARGLEHRPIRVTFEPPPNSRWKPATQLLPTADSLTFTAPDLQYFMDSPTELSDYALRSWPVHSGAHDYTIRLAVHSQATPEQLDRYEAMAQRVVAAEEAVYGEFPQYEPGTYTFIADYLPWVYGDGMEHRNSTIIASSRATLGDNPLALLGTLAHEYFHSWNMERIRAKEIEPFDFERANMSPTLWFGEGFTNYYGKLALRRSGAWDDSTFAASEGATLDYVIHAPGRKFHAPTGMSQLAPFVDAATSIDAENFQNTYVSYYPWGEVIALGLDLTLRERFHKPLDGFMRLMWQRYGKTGTPYRLEDIQRALGDYTGDSAFARGFFDRYVRGHDVQDYAPLLAPAGLLLRPAHPNAAWLGRLGLAADSAGARVTSGTLIGTPVYQAGLDRGDVIESLDGHPLGGGSSGPATADSIVGAVLAAHHPGDAIPVAYRSRGMRKQGTITLAADPQLELVTYEQAGRPVTDSMGALRHQWLDGQ